MTDPVVLALASGERRDLTLYGGLALAGILTSCGPCLAPRALAIAAFAARRRLRWPIALAFAGGATAGYVLLGFGVQAFAPLVAGSRFAYLVLAIALALGGAGALLREGASHPDGCARASVPGVCAVGAASVLIVSPCCTPVVLAVAAAGTAGGALHAGAALLAFAGGHLAPLLACAALGERGADAIGRVAGSDATATIAGALMLALAAYYGILA